MMHLLFFLILSCSKKQPLNHVTAKTLFENKICLETLRKNMQNTGCDQLKYAVLGNYDTMIRCHKPDEERGEFWDNYIFRISPSHLKYKNEASKKLIETHTICLDNTTRIEAYPPNQIRK